MEKRDDEEVDGSNIMRLADLWMRRYSWAWLAFSPVEKEQSDGGVRSVRLDLGGVPFVSTIPAGVNDDGSRAGAVRLAL